MPLTDEEEELMKSVGFCLNEFGKTLHRNDISVNVGIMAFITGLKEMALIARKEGAPQHYVAGVARSLRDTADLFEHGTEPRFDLDMSDLKKGEN